MQLLLDKLDLKKPYTRNSIIEAKFEDFIEQAQKAINVVGFGVLKDDGLYTRVYAPKSGEQDE